MAGNGLDPREVRRRLTALRRGIEAGESRADTARRLGIKLGTFRRWVSESDAAQELLQDMGEFADDLPEVPEPEEQPEPPPREQRGAKFWQQKAKQAEDRAERLEHLLDELQRIASQPLRPVDWLTPVSNGRRRSVVMPQTNDFHYEDVIASGEIQGMNSFTPEIARRRFVRYVDAACEIGTRWASDTECVGALWGILGDSITGTIHEELAETNALTSDEACLEVSELYAAAARKFADAFGRVLVTSVPGNHGRKSRKPKFKGYGRESYDTLICAMAARATADDERITWQISPGHDLRNQVFGWRVLDTHGDRIGTGGGQGFAGPVLPIARGAKKIQEQQASVGEAYDVLRGGHYHFACEPQPGVLFGGSVPGYSEFAYGIRARQQLPSQKLALLTEKWGLRERMDVLLEDPSPRPKPRLRAVGGKLEAV